MHQFVGACSERSRLLIVVVFLSWSLASPENLFFPTFAYTNDDDASYVAYAMSLALDGDLDFTNEIAGRLTTFPNGHVRPVHPSGPGIMAAPVVALFSVGDRLSSHPVIDNRGQFGGSWSFLGYLVASLSALIAGISLLSRSILSIVSRLSPSFIILAICGAGVPYYGFKRFTMGQSFEFFAAALVVWAIVRLRRLDSNPLVSAFLVMLGVACSLLSRPANINIVLLPIIVHLILSLVARTSNPRETRADSARWAVVGTTFGLALTFVTNAFLYGSYYPSFGMQYLSPGFDIANAMSIAGSVNAFVSDTVPRAAQALSRVSHLPIVVFTQEYGLLWFMPIVPIGGILLFGSLILTWRRHHERRTVALVAVLSLIYTAIPLGVVLVWQSHASSFGFRYLFSLLPLGLLGFALHATLPSRNAVATQPLIIITISVLALFSLLGQVFHLAIPDLRLSSIQNSFGIFVRSVNPTFASALLAALVQPEAWTNMLARGLLGFVALLVLPASIVSFISATTGVRPLARAETATELANTYSVALEGAAPGTAIASIVLLGVLVPMLILRLAGGPAVSVRPPHVLRTHTHRNEELQNLHTFSMWRFRQPRDRPSLRAPAETELVQFSVIIPVYNRQELATEALTSVLNQSLQPYEVILVDDRSHPPFTLDRIWHSSAQVRVIRAPIQMGAAGARNLGCMYARGSHMAFLDSDDLWLSSHLSDLAEVFQSNPGLSAAYALSRGKSTMPLGAAKLRAIHSRRLSWPPPTWKTPATAVRRSAFHALGGFDTSLRYREDTDFFLRLQESGPIGSTRRISVVVRTQRDGLSSASGKDLMRHKTDYARVVHRQIERRQFAGSITAPQIASMLRELRRYWAVRFLISRQFRRAANEILGRSE